MRNLFTWIMAGAASLVAPAIVALAADKPVLTIYTYESSTSDWGPGPAIETAFEENCNCDLQFVSLDSSIGILWDVSNSKAQDPRQISFLASTPT